MHSANPIMFYSFAGDVNYGLKFGNFKREGEYKSNEFR